ncbi:hypothetical protein [Bosea sp. NPDC055594]
MQSEATAAANEMLGSDPSKATGSKMELVQPAPAAMPSEEDGARTIYESNPRNKRWDLLADKVKDRYREQARAVLALFAPVLAEKERLADQVDVWRTAADANLSDQRAAEARALAAEAALVAVEKPGTYFANQLQHEWIGPDGVRYSPTRGRRSEDVEF